MNRSFDLDEIDVFTTGAIGPKGQRIFYLQARTGEGTLSFRLEKQQVIALAEYLAGMLADLPEPGPESESDLTLIEPVMAEWIIGSIGVAYAEADDRILVWAEELLDEEEEASGEAATVRFRLRREQVEPFVERARDVVSAGRPPCPYCGRPLDDDDGSFCPCFN